eukprot:NODE_17_length_3609_cov_184.315449_g13_i0.p1 GENE.NODE_17_length_3609_cov_184.315449_g13_i0~~NODE_17_length_3609_cov_184.315449_g13_i0.p1  ORF type:complete len:1157 (+),score=236.03 NODE_17_length_3609_cov_184.315449_g13_i0:57-3473(+)
MASPNIAAALAAVLVALLCLCVSTSASSFSTSPFAVDSPLSPLIELASVAIDPASTPGIHSTNIIHNEDVLRPAFPKFSTMDLRVVRIPFLLKWKGLVTSDVEATLAAHCEFPTDLSYLPRRTFLLRETLSTAQRLLKLEGVVWVGPFLPHYKLAPALAAEPSTLTTDRDRDSDPSSVLVHLLPSTVDPSNGWLTTLTSDLHAALLAVHPTLLSISVYSPPPTAILRVACGEGKEPCPPALLNALLEHSQVVWVEPESIMRVQNKFTRGIVQTGNSHSEPLYDAGLDGQGQVVGVSDTGMDHDHCFFRDPHRKIPVQNLDVNHRKIIRYQHLGIHPGPQGTEDMPGGHGTHVVGSLVGDSLTGELSEYRGLAHKAKVSFFDLSGAETEHVSMPGSLDTHLFAIQYADGARICSQSWGGSRAIYNHYAADVDRFSAGHREFLAVFAAGNDADIDCESRPTNWVCGSGTVLAPGTAKNALTVGSSMSPAASWEEIGQGTYILKSEGHDMIVVRGHFSPTPPSVISAPMVVSDPFDACENIRNDLTGKIVLIERGTCFFTLKANRAQSRGALAVIIINHLPGDPLIMGAGDDAKISIATYMITKSDGIILKALAEAGKEMSFPFPGVDKTKKKSKKNLSNFSSRGPTKDHRLKPDVVAPGEYTISAKSDGNPNTNNCDLTEAMGTSMAAPFVSALALLLRQYFLERWYPGGVKGKGHLISPSGALVKALIINSAQPLTGMVDWNAQGAWINLTGTPNYMEGFGLVQLSSILPLYNRPRVLLWFTEKPIMAHQVHSTCLTYDLEEGDAFRATLVWTDPAGSSMAKWTLVNDLDLQVIDPQGRVHYGNVRPEDEFPRRDRVNNVEKVLISNAKIGTYTVLVVGVEMRTAQIYSVTATGKDGSECVAVCAGQPPCSGHGLCQQGICDCDLDHYGADCSGEVVSLHNQRPVESIVSVDSWRYYKFDMNTILTKVVFKMTRKDQRSDPDIYVHLGAHPTLESAMWSDAGCDTCASAPRNELQMPSPLPSPPATYYVGIHSECCFDASITIEVITNEIFHPPPTVFGLAMGSVYPTLRSLDFTLPLAASPEGRTMVVKGVDFGGSTDQCSVVYGPEVIRQHAVPHNDVSVVELFRSDPLLLQRVKES